MTNTKSTGKELVPVAYATNVRPLAMFEPPKQMRQKNTPRKQTVDPSSINIEDSEDESEVVKSTSPTPRKKVAARKSKGPVVDAESQTVQISQTPRKRADNDHRSEVVKSSSRSPGKKVPAMKKASKVAAVKKVTPTKKLDPIKIKIKDHGKKPKTEKVCGRKRKRPNREDEGVIDLQTPTKRVTRSSEAVQKKRVKDIEKNIDKRKAKKKKVQGLPTVEQEEKEDKGFKRTTRSQVSKDRKPKLKKKGDEEEEEWDVEEGDEEEKGKGKKGQKNKGIKGKEVNNPQNVMRHIQYRSTLNTVVKLIKSIPTGEFTPLQIQEIKKTPFAELVLGIVEANLDEAYVRKSDPVVLKLVQQYEGTGGRFKLGGKSVKITAKELTLIFGIQSGTTRIVLNPTPRVPNSDFAERLCPGPKGQRILTIPVLREFFAKAVKGTTLEDAKDLAHVLCLLLIGTLFVPNTQARVSWAYLDFIVPLETSSMYNWSSFITEEIIHELNLRGSSNPTKVGGCIMGLMYWLCEHVHLINQGDPHNIPRFIKWRLGDLRKELRTINLDSLDPLTVFSSELEPNDEEEELYTLSPVPEHEADGKSPNLKMAVDMSGDEVVEDTIDDDTDIEQDEVVNLRGIIRKLTEDNTEKDRIISEFRRENKEKNDTISELRRRIAKHPQTTTPGFGFEGISAQFDKDHLEHENATLQTEIGAMLIEKDIVEEKLEVAGDIIDDFVTHSVTQTYRTCEAVGEKESKDEDVGEKESKDKGEHEGEDKQELEEEEEEGEEGGFEIDADEGGPEHIMVPDAEVDSTTIEAYTSILECDTPKVKRGKTKVKVKSSSLTRGVKKTQDRVEKRLDDYVYVDLKKGAKNISKQKWNPSAAPLIHWLPNTDATLLHQIVDCSDADLHCTVWTNDVTREVVPLEDIMKLLQGGDVSNWMIDGFTRMLTIEMDKDNFNHGNVAFFPCTIWTILHHKTSDMRTVILDPKLHFVFENVQKHGIKYYRYLVFPMNGSGDKLLKITPYHWTVLIFDVRKNNWMHYNSLKKRDGRDPILKDATVVKKYVENYMKDRHAELKNQSTSTKILFQDTNFDGPICSPQSAPQQENTSVDCGVIVCMIMEILAHLEPIPKTLPKTEIDKFRAGLVSRFLNDEGRSWTIKKWEARWMGKGSQ